LTLTRAEEAPLLVTGAASGIGRACVRLALERGGTVVGIDRSELEAVAGLRAVRLDLEDVHAVSGWIAGEVVGGGGFSGLILMAGVIVAEGAAYDPAAWSRTLRVNLAAPAQMVLGLLPVLDAGTPVVFTSAVSVSGASVSPAYPASQAGVEALMRSLPLSLGKDRLRCNAVRPGSVDTPLHHSIRSRQGAGFAARYPDLAAPEDVAEVALFLTTPASEGIAGQVLTVDAGGRFARARARH
jgi:3-oxoacyl-[acyl-carrier protein] reductase